MQLMPVAFTDLNSLLKLGYDQAEKLLALLRHEKNYFLTAPPQIHDNAEDAANTASQLHKSTHAH